MPSSLPFDQPGTFYRGNLHVHSNRSDGKLPPGAVLAAYRDRGYDFLSLTDHFMPHTHWNRDDGGFCTVADTTAWRTDTFTTIFGAELHGPGMANGERWHILANDLPLDFAPWTEGETGPQLAARARAAGAYVSIAHPEWNGLTIADASTLLESVDAVEVYNHSCEVSVDRGRSWHYMDVLLGQGHRLQAVATDDAHFNNEDDPASGAFGGWINVRAGSLDPGALMTAIRAGHFYSSSGAELHDVRVEGNTLTVACSPAERIVVTGLGSRSAKESGANIERGEFGIEKFRAGGFCRVTVIGMDSTRAWTNPIWLDESLEV